MVTTRSMTSEDALQHVLLNVLLYPPDHLVFTALKIFDIEDIDSFMYLNETDFHQPFTRPDPLDVTKTITATLPHIHGRKLYSTIAWFFAQPLHELATWYELTPEILRAWQLNRLSGATTPITSTNTTPTPTAATSSFRQSLKVTINDYPKLKEDKGWRLFNRQLLATAANHDTIDVLTPNYVPSTALLATFEHKQVFMFNVLTQCITTGKGKVCVRNHDSTRDAQKAYAELVAIYQDDLSTQLLATALRLELTNLKLDDKWRTSYETFLTSWTSKLQELETIEDQVIPDQTKRIWITSSLSTHKEMHDAIRQATTTELTLGGIAGTTTRVTWTHFYGMLLNNAKLLDQHQTTTAATQRRTHTAEQGTSTATTSTAPRSRKYTPYTGPDMTLTAGMSFTTADWLQLTPTQQQTLKRLNSKKKSSAVNQHTTTPALPPAPAVTLEPPPPPVTPAAPAPGSHIRHVLSAAASRNADTFQHPQQIISNGRTYTLNQVCTHTPPTPHDPPIPSVSSLIDGGANGGMSGCDVRVLATTGETVNISGIGDKFIHNLPLCTVAATIYTHQGPIIGIFHRYSHYGKGHTIHSVNQMKSFGVLIDDTPRQLSTHGQSIRTPDGYHIPISIRQGLPHMDMRPPTDLDLATYPHVTFTSDMPWDPTVLDNEYTLNALIHTTNLNPSTTPQVDYGETPPLDCGEINTTNSKLVRPSFPWIGPPPKLKAKQPPTMVTPSAPPYDYYYKPPSGLRGVSTGTIYDGPTQVKPTGFYTAPH
jgi:hypothetical protein